MTAPLQGTALVADDERDICTTWGGILEDAGLRVLRASDLSSALQALEDHDVDVAFIDINLGNETGFDVLEQARRRGIATDIVLITGNASVANAIEATRRGAFDYLTKPRGQDQLVEVAGRALASRKAFRELSQQAGGEDEAAKAAIVGQSPAMQEVYKTIGRMASSPTTVLIQGESGTGKEVVARAIHDYSVRASGPFVAVNCSAIPADLLESEMFGHERGAFTGATDRRIGKFEQAKGGTLFLDEIGDMPLALQGKLLRVLQEREFSRVGGHDLIPTDCRVLAATNRDLEGEVEAGRFREDLYFRLKVVVIELPPLRARRGDIPALVRHFVERLNAREHFDVKGVSAEAMALLQDQSWKGNVRELENVLLRAAALAPGRVLGPGDLPVRSAAPALDASGPLPALLAAKIRGMLDETGLDGMHDLHARVLAMVEKPLLEAVLEATGGNQLKTADILGINRNTLRKKINEYGIALPGRGRP